MQLPSLEVKPSFNSKADVDILAIFQESVGKSKKALAPKGAAASGAYTQLIEKFRGGEVFTGANGSVQYIRFGGKAPVENCLFVGMGDPAEITEEKVRQAGGNAFAKLKAEKATSIVVHLDTLFGVKGLKADLSHLGLSRAFAQGLVLAAYEFTKHKSKKSSAKKDGKPEPMKFIFVTAEKALKTQLDRAIYEVEAEIAAMAVTRDWSNEPSNIGTPEYFASESRRLAKEYGLKCKVLGKRECEKEKMGLFLGVAQGAVSEPKIVVLEYVPAGSKKNLKTVALVGKGITFDSGGISLKPSLRMEDMKHDMTGAATVMGAILLAAKLKVPNRVICLMAFAENMPDGNAIQPGCVLTARSGKTVEVTNTDAEGRLILGDALDYVQDMNPDVIIDAATLTGAVGIALGKQCCAILATDDVLADSLKRSGESCGERMWQLPMWDEYFEDMKSDTADMRNSPNDSGGGVIRGAIFLKQFIRKGMAWVHMDIASMAYGISHLSYIPKKGATGLYVRSLAKFAGDY